MKFESHAYNRVAPAARGLLLTLLLPMVAFGQTALPSTETLEGVVKEAYAKFKGDNSGKNADYIPALAKVPSKLFGLTIVTADGKVISVGDVDYPFSMQSCSKVFTLCLLLQESGDQAILDKVSVVPTGERFNSIGIRSSRRECSRRPVRERRRLAHVSTARPEPSSRFGRSA